jgi:hypothetical protein
MLSVLLPNALSITSISGSIPLESVALEVIYFQDLHEFRDSVAHVTGGQISPFVADRSQPGHDFCVPAGFTEPMETAI